MRCRALVVAGIFCVSPAAAEKLTLEQAIAEAIAGSAALAARSAQVEQAGAEAAALKTRQLPQVKIEGGAGYLLDEVKFTFPRGAFGVYPATGPIPGNDIPIEAGDSVTLLANLQIAQPLSQLPRLRLAARAAAAGQAAAAAELEGARQQLIAAVSDLYFGLLENTASLRAGAPALARLAELVRQLEVHAARQTVLPGDLLAAKLALAQREFQQRQLENAAAGRREELLRLLGRPLDSPLELAELPPPAPYEGELAAARAAALAHRPELLAARHRADQAELAARAEKAGRWPELSLALQYLEPYQLDPLPDHIASLGLQFSWEPWDWGRKRQEHRAREEAARAARAALADAEGQVATEVGRAFRRLGEAREAVGLAELAVELAQERLRVARARFEHQANQAVDLLEAEEGLSEAEARAGASRYQLWQAHSDFRRTLAEEKR